MRRGNTALRNKSRRRSKFFGPGGNWLIKGQGLGLKTVTVPVIISDPLPQPGGGRRQFARATGRAVASAVDLILKFKLPPLRGPPLPPPRGRFLSPS